ncbi:MAG: hypothetical protein ACFE9I_18170 [Candidatus Hermodarchaeota archaeon]
MASQGGYALHHFLAEMMRKMSSNVADIVLTSDNLHQNYEKYKNSREGEAFIRGLMKTIQDLIYMESAPGKFVQKIKPIDVFNTLVKNLGTEKGNEIYKSWTSGPTKLTQFLKSLAEFNDRRVTYALSNDPNKFRQFLEDVYTETWNNRNKDAINYYHFIRKSWVSNVAILFSYDADINIMNSIYRIGIPIV